MKITATDLATCAVAAVTGLVLGAGAYTLATANSLDDGSRPTQPTVTQTATPTRQATETTAPVPAQPAAAEPAAATTVEAAPTKPTKAPRKATKPAAQPVTAPAAATSATPAAPDTKVCGTPVENLPSANDPHNPNAYGKPTGTIPTAVRNAFGTNVLYQQIPADMTARVRTLHTDGALTPAKATNTTLWTVGLMYYTVGYCSGTDPTTINVALTPEVNTGTNTSPRLVYPVIEYTIHATAGGYEVTGPTIGWR